MSKHLRTNVLAAAATALLCACAAPPPSAGQQALAERVTATIPVCDGEKDCAAKWEAAQLFVVNNAGYKLQTATSVIIETFTPPQPSPLIAMRVTKEPLGGGKYRILGAVICSNGGLIGVPCQRPPLEVLLDFNRQVAAAS